MNFNRFLRNTESAFEVIQEEFISHAFVCSLVSFIFIRNSRRISDALANTIKKCMTQLSDIPEREARYFCGHTPMKYCAVYVGLDGLPLDFVA